MNVHDVIIHEMLRKKERQGNTTQLAQDSYFSKRKLPRVGFEPTTVQLLGVALTNLATEAAQLAGLESHTGVYNTKQPPKYLEHHKPDKLVNSNSVYTMYMY